MGKKTEQLIEIDRDHTACKFRSFSFVSFSKDNASSMAAHIRKLICYIFAEQRKNKMLSLIVGNEIILQLTVQGITLLRVVKFTRGIQYWVQFNSSTAHVLFQTEDIRFYGINSSIQENKKYYSLHSME